jgi:phenylpyruvate tautomerase
MPLLRLTLPFAIDKEKEEPVMKALSKILAEELHKPEQYVMITVGKSSMLMSGTREKCAFADIRSIGGLSDVVMKKLSGAICSYLDTTFGISPGRVYLNFTDMAPQNWGWNNATFG